MINGALWVLGCQLVGEVVVRWLGLPVPGPVLGMVLLFGVLSVRRPGPQSGTLRVADGLLRHLQLLFVPVTVGIMVHAGTIRQEWLPVTGGLVLSWTAGLATVAGLATLLVRRRGTSGETAPGDAS
ncbi:CidA/LrgA family protein [Janibacter alittae]|uniref:CidA/LrgA family protein n=1 Tax=Janibacter alittae TaxID=3115209 RepID=A0ABZ2MEC3_9MICO